MKSKLSHTLSSWWCYLKIGGRTQNTLHDKTSPMTNHFSLHNSYSALGDVIYLKIRKSYRRTNAKHHAKHHPTHHDKSWMKNCSRSFTSTTTSWSYIKTRKWWSSEIPSCANDIHQCESHWQFDANDSWVWSMKVLSFGMKGLAWLSIEIRPRHTALRGWR